MKTIRTLTHLLLGGVLAWTAHATDPNPTEPHTGVNRLIALAPSGKIELDSVLTFKNDADRTAFATELGISGGVTGVHTVNGRTGTVTLTAGDVGLTIGGNVQAHDAELDALSGLTSAADEVPYFTGSGTAATTAFSALGRLLVADADAAAARLTLGATTLGVNLFTGANNSSGLPSWPRINSDSSLTLRTSAQAAADLGAVLTSGTYANPSWLTSVAASKLTGAVAIANGGSGATNSAGLITASRGTRIYSNGANLIAGTPDYVGQLAIGADGSAAFGYTTSAGGFVSGGVSLLNPTYYMANLTASGTLTGSAVVSGTGAFSGALSSNYLTTFATTAGSHNVIGASGANYIDNSLYLENTTGGYPALTVVYAGDGIADRSATFGYGPTGAGPYADICYIGMVGSVAHPNPNGFIVSQEYADGVPSNAHVRMEATDWTTKRVVLYGLSTTNNRGPVGVDVDAAGTVALGTSAHSAAKMLTVNGDTAISGTLTAGSGPNTITTTAGLVDGGKLSSHIVSPTAVKTSNYTAAAGDLVPCDTTSGAFTVTLPAAPTDGAQVAIKLVVLGGSNAVTIACAGSDVFNKTGGGTSGTLSLLNQALFLQYKASGAIWYVLADDIALSQLDARFQATLGTPAAGQIPVGNAGGTAYAASTLSGDATLASTGAITVTKTSGSAFAPSATTNALNASNISSGTLPDARNIQSIATSATPTFAGATINGLLGGTWHAWTLGTGTVTVATTTFVNITGLSASIGAGETWCYHVMCPITGATNGCKFQVTGPASPTSVQINHTASNNLTTNLTREVMTAFSTPNGVSNFTAAITSYMEMWITVANGANAGTVQVQFATASGTNTITALAGRTIEGVREN